MLSDRGRSSIGWAQPLAQIGLCEEPGLAAGAAAGMCEAREGRLVYVLILLWYSPQGPAIHSIEFNHWRAEVSKQRCEEAAAAYLEHTQARVHGATTIAFCVPK